MYVSDEYHRLPPSRGDGTDGPSLYEQIKEHFAPLGATRRPSLLPAPRVRLPSQGRGTPTSLLSANVARGWPA